MSYELTIVCKVLHALFDYLLIDVSANAGDDNASGGGMIGAIVSVTLVAIIVISLIIILWILRTRKQNRKD